MIKLSFEGDDIVVVEEIQNLLDQNNIPYTIRNESPHVSIVGIPLQGSAPEIWLANEEDAAKAEGLWNELQGSLKTQSAASWTCPNCGETIEGQFTSCWKCETQEEAVPSVE